MSSSGEGDSLTRGKDDGVIAITILIVALVFVAFGGFYYWRSSSQQQQSSPLVIATSRVESPKERDEYLKAKESLNPDVPEELETLKKLLMKRALRVIPMLIEHQNEGQSIDKLYKRGILTDDIHFKVKELKEFFDQEFVDVKSEADELVEGWGQHVWEQASYFSQAIRQRVDGGHEEQDHTTHDDGEDDFEPEQSHGKSSGAGKKKKGKKGGNKDSSNAMVLDSEEQKILEAEKMAQKLIEEEEREKQSKGKAGKPKGKSTNRTTG